MATTPIPDFTVDKTTGVVGDTFNFTDLSQNVQNGDLVRWFVNGVKFAEFVQGGGVDECPIGDTFYAAGYDEYPHNTADWGGTTSIVNDELVFNSVGIIPFLTDIDCSCNRSFDFEVINNTSGYLSLYLSNGITELVKIGWMFSPGSLSAAYRIGGVYTTFGAVNDSLGVTVKGTVAINNADQTITIDCIVKSNSDGQEVIVSGVEDISGLGLDIDRLSIRNQRAGTRLPTIRIVGQNLPNQCQGVQPQNPTWIADSEGLKTVRLDITQGGIVYSEEKVDYLNILPDEPEKNTTFTYNGIDINFDIVYPLKSELSLGLLKMTDSLKRVKYRYVKPSTVRCVSAPFLGYELQNKLDEYSTGENFDATGAQGVLTTLDGVYPFTPLYTLTSGMAVAIEFGNNGNADFFGNYTNYSSEIIPASALVDSAISGTSCSSGGWILNGVSLPFPEGEKWQPRINNTGEISQNWSGYGDILGSARVDGDTTTVTVNVDRFKAYELLKMLRDTDWTLGTVPATFGGNYYPFGRHRGDSLNVILHDTIISVVQETARQYKITFSLQYQQ